MNTQTFQSQTHPLIPSFQASPRLINRKLNIIRHAVHAVQKKTGHAANQDVAAYLGVTLAEYNNILQEANSYCLLSSKQEVA